MWTQLNPSSRASSRSWTDERMVGRMGQRQDGLDLVVADEPAHRPGLLPGPAIDLARLDDPELLQEDVVVAVPPELLAPIPAVPAINARRIHVRRLVAIAPISMSGKTRRRTPRARDPS